MDLNETATTNLSGVTVTHRRIDFKIVRNILLIWLDSNIDENNEDSLNTITKFQQIFNTINTFKDSDQCIKFIEEMNNYKICVILTDHLGQYTVPHIHGMPQIDSIIIYCENKQRNEDWAKNWPKIKGVFTEITPIVKTLKEVTKACEQNCISFSFVPVNSDITKKTSDRLNTTFMYTQILKEILLSITFEQTHIQQFIDYCRDVFADNRNELKNVKEFEKQYHLKKPIWWYTCECFLYPMLNRALRLMDVQIIIKLGFFINDLHHHIEQLHKEQFSDRRIIETFKVYRGQALSKTDFEQMLKMKGGLMSFTNFLSTSKNRDVSISFVMGALSNPDSIRILFDMTIDPSKSTTPFADIREVSAIQTEEEVLFSMHTTFRIDNITSIIEHDRFFLVEMTLTSDDDQELRILTDHIREETFPNSTGWYRLGSVLLKMGYYDKAQQVYEVLFGQTKEESVKASIYNQLGSTKDDQGEYEEAIILYEKSLEIYKKIFPTTHPDLAAIQNNIGLVYYNMCEYSTALSYYKKTLDIQQQSLPSNHPNLASTYINIGNVYDSMGEYMKALSSHEKALEIQQKSLPPTHPDLASTYNNIGNVYDSMSEYSKALSAYTKSLLTKQQSLPPTHPDLASTNNNIGLVYYNMGQFTEALSYYEKAHQIQKQSLPSMHPDLASTCNNIGLVYYKMEEYTKALSYNERAVDIGQHILPSNHPDIQIYKTNLDLVKQKL